MPIWTCCQHRDRNGSASLARKVSRLDRFARNRRIVPVLFLITSLVWAPGCSYYNGFLKPVGPDFCPPAAPVAAQWIDQTNPQVISDNQGVDDQAWWHVFNDPALSRLVQTARQQNLPLRTAGKRVTQARYQRKIAASQFFPQAQQVFGDYRRNQISTTTVPQNLDPPGFLPRSFDNWSTGFDASWELDVWGRYRRNLESVDAELAASVDDYHDILVCLVAETAATYIEIRTVQERLALTRSNVEIQERSLDLAKKRLKGGVATKLDVDQAQANLATTRAAVYDLETQLRQAVISLCVLQGIPPTDLLTQLGDAPIPIAPTEVAVGIPAELLRRRPDLRAAERQAAAESARIGIAASELFPSFTISGSMGVASEELRDLFDSSSFTGGVGPSFHWNVLNYGRLVARVDKQTTKFQEAVLNYQETALQANADVENALVAFLNSQLEAVQLREAAEATREAVQTANDEYQAGTASFNRVFVMEGLLVVQENALAQVRGDVAISLVALYKALGGGWQICCSGYQPAIEADGWSTLPIADSDAIESSTADPKASTPDAKASIQDPKVSTPDPKASIQDPTASKPDPKASTPDPKPESGGPLSDATIEAYFDSLSKSRPTRLPRT